MILSDIANLLAAARRNGIKVDASLLDSLQNESDAYQIQSLLEAPYGSEKIGYKIGATNEATQKKLGCDAPFFGPMFQADCYESGASFDSANEFLGGEAEFAFVIDRDVPTDITMNIDKIKEYIRSAHVAVELIGRRSIGDGLPSIYAVIADFGGNAAFVHGPAIEAWRSMDLASVQVVAHTDAEQTNAGSGEAVLGNPLNSLLWLHDTLRARGAGLLAGQWITTGTCLGVIPPKPASHVVVNFEGCGEISYRLGDSVQ